MPGRILEVPEFETGFYNNCPSRQPPTNKSSKVPLPSIQLCRRRRTPLIPLVCSKETGHFITGPASFSLDLNLIVLVCSEPKLKVGHPAYCLLQRSIKIPLSKSQPACLIAARVGRVDSTQQTKVLWLQLQRRNTRHPSITNITRLF